MKTKTSNKKSRDFVTERKEFKASNLSGEQMGKVYVVKSYGWFPLFVFIDNKWYENSTKYSVSTSKQKSQCRPLGEDTIELSKVELDELIEKNMI